MSMSCQVLIHGVGVEVSSSSLILLDPIRRFFRYFPLLPEGHPISIRMEVTAISSLEEVPCTARSSKGGKVSSQSGWTRGDEKRREWHCDIYIEPDRLVLDYHAQGLSAVDFQNRRASIYLIDPEAMHEDVRIAFVHESLIQLLKREGLYTLHATALEKDGQGILIPGCSGRGKTTAFIALLRSGFRCISDDHPLLHEKDGKLELLAFQEKVDITDQSVRFFPELVNANPGLLYQGVLKKYFFVEDVYPNSIAHVCQPRLLFFPQVIDSSHSLLEPFPRARALEELLPETLAVHDKAAAKREFQFLSRMVQELDCYLLYFGHDVLDLPSLVLPLLKA